MKRIIINGANGYVASNFINQLLLDDYEVIALVRGNERVSAEKRMLDTMDEINDGTFVKPDKLKVIDYSLLEKNFGIADETLKELFYGAVDYYHLAASLKYDLKAKEEIFQTNMEGVKNSINVFLKYAGAESRFFFISTAYSCGKFDGVFEEKFYENADISRFRNYYEQSKRYAENLIRKYIDEEGMNAHILRLSQVVGHSETGVTNTDYGVFDFARRIQSLATRHPNRKVRVKVDAESSQNLVPIDTVVAYLMQTVRVHDLPVIMNMVAKKAIRNRFILETLCRLLPIELIPQIDIEKSEMDAYERIILIGMSFTSSYTGTNLLFDTSKLDAALKVEASELSHQAVYRMLAYFLENSNDKKEKVAC